MKKKIVPQKGGIKTQVAKLNPGLLIPQPKLNPKQRILGQGGAASRGSY